MTISEETLLQAREEAETGNDQYSRGFVSAVITELLEARKKQRTDDALVGELLKTGREAFDQHLYEEDRPPLDSAEKVVIDCFIDFLEEALAKYNAMRGKV